MKVKVIEVNSWFDPGREREATDALIAQGADVVAHVTDSSAPTLAAEKAGKRVVGFHSDRASFGPSSQLTAVIPIFGEFYADYDEQYSQEEIEEFTDLVIGQDLRIIESQRPKRLPIHGTDEFSLPADRTSVHYRRWLRSLGATYGTT